MVKNAIKTMDKSLEYQRLSAHENRPNLNTNENGLPFPNRQRQDARNFGRFQEAPPGPRFGTYLNADSFNLRQS